MDTDNKLTIGKTDFYALLAFLLSTLIGIALPGIALPWMVALLLYGLWGSRCEQGSIPWNLSRSALASAMVLAVIILAYQLLFKAVMIQGPVAGN